MPDYTDSENLLRHVQSIAKEQQLKLIETERKPRLSEKEAEYLDFIARMKAWQEQEKANDELAKKTREEP
jgi:hypothetical protein